MRVCSAPINGNEIYVTKVGRWTPPEAASPVSGPKVQARAPLEFGEGQGCRNRSCCARRSGSEQGGRAEIGRDLERRVDSWRVLPPVGTAGSAGLDFRAFG